MKNKQREIKFRAWDLIPGVGYKMIGWENIKKNSMEFFWNDERFADRVIMQYTNLKDKNGVEIYEGDIIALRGADDEKDYFYEIYKAEGGTWMGCNELYYDLKSKDFVKLEVVGNIYENSELLEDKICI